MTETPLIPRQLLFGNPDRASVQLSPDGAQLSWIAPLDGVLNVWVAPRDDPAVARPITHDTGRGIRHYGWAYTSEHILYVQDKNGDENWRAYIVHLPGGEVLDLTPWDGVQARVQDASLKFPHEILLCINRRDPHWHDLYRANIITGEVVLLRQNDGVAGFLTDDDYRLRGALRMTEDGGIQMLKPGEHDGWEPWDFVPPEDALTTGPVGFDKSGGTLFLKDSRGRDTAALMAQDLATGEKTLLAEDPQADAVGLLRHPTQKHIQAVSFIYERKRWQILDPAIEPDLAFLRTVCPGDVEITSRALDDRFWVAVYVVDDGPTRYYLYDRQQRRASFLFSDRQALQGYRLAKMHSLVIKARDGLDLVCYYTLPLGSDSDGDGIPDRPMPLVLNPHGGPWWRDFWGYHPWHQWLANRGYAVLCVNFRSSTGLGKAFVNAGNLEWGGKIMEDQQDAVRWAIRRGIADKNKVAVAGGSFGGYSTLAGLTMYPDVFACGVDLVGPSNLITLLETVPPYWKPMLDQFTTRVGDHRTPEGRALLAKHSPLTYVERIRSPLLIGQGANDPRVKQAESDQIVRAMQARHIPVTYVLYPDEGHGFARPENSLSFYAIAEAFLARCLGGRYEPIGDDFKGSSLQVLAGVEDVPGLKTALDARGHEAPAEPAS